ncbi:hypothetical protein R5W23_003008 [Gemmata sp. JC673]|uniref:WD40 repeat domain-containing protein n=1 Tax=Gemmata algarum TaxID=2975278 RepID=A0ABU5EV93_9BACT|nr:hypothetical protein [Gemmata algarum]MDY3557743.1 hypothetical protein [Gemmata algarum]
MKVPDLGSHAVALVDEATVVVVGTKGVAPLGDPNELPPNAAFVDLATKAVRPFPTGHTARVNSVSVAHGRVATTSISTDTSPNRDRTVRIWDLKAKKTTASITIEKPADNTTSFYEATWFRKSERIAVLAGERVLVFDPAKPDDRIELACPPAPKRWLSGPVAVSPDDGRVVGSTGGGELIVWDMATRKATVIRDVTPPEERPFEWNFGPLAFGRNGHVFVCRTRSDDEVPEKTAEKDVPADRRGLVQVDVESGRLTALGFGHTIRTHASATDPTGVWVATVGFARPDQPNSGKSTTAGEVRVYHLATKELACQKQVGTNPLIWVSFTPSGKRLVAATAYGEVMWWDVRAN